MCSKLSLTLVLSVFGYVTVSDATDYTGAQIFDVRVTDPNQLKYIKDAVVDLDIWHQNLTNIEFLVSSDKVQKLKTLLDEKKIGFSVTVDDVQKLIDGEKTLERRGLNKRTGDLNLDAYNSLDDIYKWMDKLAKSYPNVVSIDVIGETYEKRSIKVMNISCGEPHAKAVFIDAGAHSRSWISIATALYLINELVVRRSKQPKFLLNVDFYILPVFNPDGYVYTHNYNRLWRKNRSPGPNCMGVDLLRNFDVHFGGEDGSEDPCDQIYRGPSAFSELETKAFSKYVMKIKKRLEVHVTLKSFGQVISVPYFYTKDEEPSDIKELMTIAEQSAKAMEKSGGETYRTSRASDIAIIGGTGLDWMKKKVGVKYTFLYDLRDAGKYKFMIPSRMIRATGKEVFEGIKVVVKSAVDASSKTGKTSKSDNAEKGKGKTDETQKEKGKSYNTKNEKGKSDDDKNVKGKSSHSKSKNTKGSTAKKGRSIS